VKRKLKNKADIDQKIKDLQAFDEQIRSELRGIRDANVQEIFKNLNDVIEAYGKKKGYDFIFSDRALAFKKEKFNLTNAVLKELNKQYKK